MTEPTRFSIRRAAAADCSGILECLHQAFAPFQGAYTAEAFADTILSASALDDRMTRMTVVVATIPGGGIVGTVGCNFDAGEGHIRGMAILPGWQGLGVAAQLLGWVESALRAQGVRRVTLDTTAPLTRAIAFYRSNGYSPTGRTQDFFGMLLFEFAKDLAPIAQQSP
ncbi:MAG TPA: GNAT family N-acetyltransferase [Acidobacteriaceae bacterium]|nr:GNAT family N-acetyltransferase [Acidobacteriaceae bacterium]